MWQDNQILTRQDGSYIIVYNNNLYHVPNSGGWIDRTEAVQWQDVNAYAIENPTQVSPDPDDPAIPKPVPPPTVEEQIAILKSELYSIDMASIRPLRAIVDGAGEDTDKTRLDELEQQAEDIRSQIKALQANKEEFKTAKDG
jgi:hypothetical protein